MKTINTNHPALAILLVTLMARTTHAASTISQSNKPKPRDINALHLKKGESFLATRTRILKSGWTPVRMHLSDNYEYSSTEKEFARRKYFEVDSCSMDAGSLCLLHYTKAAQCLRLEKRGEQLHQMEVFYWDEKCADPAGR